MQIKNRFRQTLGALALTLVPLISRAEPASGPASFAVVGAKVFDGQDVLPSATVLVTDGKITAVGPDVAVPAGVPTVDGKGKTLLPGLIDAHVHTYLDALERALLFGVTTELDMSADAKQAATWRQEQAQGKASSRADLYSAGTLVTAPGGHGTEYGVSIPTITKPEEAQAFVDARIAEGSDYIKIVYDDGKGFGISWATLDRATLEAVIQAAHARGKLAVVHIGTQAGARAALEAGADGLVHIFGDTPPEADFASLALAKKAFVTPTLSVVESVSGVPSGASLIEDPDLKAYVNAAEGVNLGRAFPARPQTKQSLVNASAVVKALLAAGVPVLAGTDAPNPGTAHGASLHRELELLVAAGLSPVQALAAATSVPARVFGLSDRGRIAPGLRADLVLVDGDPTSSILATRKIVSVWKGGQALERKKAEAAPAAAAPQGIGTDGLISDFEGEKVEARFGHGWEVSTDSIMGGASQASMQRAAGGAEGSAGALEVTGTVVKKAPYPWAGAMFFPGAQPMAAANLSQFKELVFWARGDGGTYEVLLFATKLGYIPARQSFVAGAEWKEHVFPIKDFSGLDGSDLMGVAFTAGVKSEAFSFRIDQVRFR